MSTINSRLEYLWQQFSARQATRAELDELMEMLTAGNHDEESLLYLRQVLEATPGSEVDRQRWEPVLRSILRQEERVPAEVFAGVPAETKVSPGVRSLLRWSAAAAVIALFIGGIYLWRKQAADKLIVAAVPKDIGPGGNKATLTLAGGQTITLDSVASGQLALQGGTRVEKLHNGQLAYQADDKTREAGGSAGNGGGAGAEAGRPLINILSTPRGGQYMLTLPDGTVVWLNSASSIRFPTAFTGESREVELTGEGYFEVKHDPLHPFRVKAGEQVVEDIGTAFNINAYTDETVTRTTLIEGAARVSAMAGGRAAPGATAPAVRAAEAGSSVTLKPAQQAQLREGQKIHVAKDVNIEEVIAWKNGQISFANADFPSLMRQVARWYDVDIKYTGEVPTKHFFGLVDRNVNLSTIIDYFRENGIHIQQQGRTIIVAP